MNTDRLLVDCKCGNCADCELAALREENRRLREALSKAQPLRADCSGRVAYIIEAADMPEEFKKQEGS